MNSDLLDASDQSVIYDIRRDVVLCEQIRDASLSNSRFGLAVENGVVGSPKWWSAVDAGTLKIERFDGVVRAFDGGPMGDSCIVRVEGDAETRSWAAWAGFKPSLVGSRVEIRYVWVKPKHPPRPDFLIDLILQVRSA